MASVGAEVATCGFAARCVTRLVETWNRKVLPTLGLAALVAIIFNPAWRAMMGFTALAVLPALFGMWLVRLSPRITVWGLMLLVLLVALALEAVLWPPPGPTE